MRLMSLRVVKELLHLIEKPANVADQVCIEEYLMNKSASLHLQIDKDTRYLKRLVLANQPLK